MEFMLFFVTFLVISNTNFDDSLETLIHFIEIWHNRLLQLSVISFDKQLDLILKDLIIIKNNTFGKPLCSIEWLHLAGHFVHRDKQ